MNDDIINFRLQTGAPIEVCKRALLINDNDFSTALESFQGITLREALVLRNETGYPLTLCRAALYMSAGRATEAIEWMNDYVKRNSYQTRSQGVNK